MAPGLLLALACTSPEGALDTDAGGTGAPDTSDSGGPGETGETGDTDTTVPEGPVLEFVGDKPKNLLIITLDTVRRDQVGWFSGLDTTPNLDALMAESVVLEDHRSCSTWTAPSMLCSLIGYNPWDQGWLPTSTDYEEEDRDDPNIPWTPDDLTPVAQALSDAGFATLLLTANEVFSDRPGGGMANGFQEVRLPLWFPAEDVTPKVELGVSELEATKLPWYFHGHFIDPHAPFVAPVEYATDADELGPFAYELDDRDGYEQLEDDWDGMTDAERENARNYMLTVYRAELRYWDEHFASMWANLDATGALDDTLFVFYTDHGEQFGEHGAFHHGVSQHEAENRAVMFFWAKNLVAKSWNQPTVHTDLAPTLYDVFDVAPSSEHTGIKLGDAPRDRQIVTFNYIYGWGKGRIALLDGDDKLIYHWDGSKFFYDLAVDPEEAENLYSPTDPRVIRMWDDLLPEVEAIAEQWPTSLGEPNDVGL